MTNTVKSWHRRRLTPGLSVNECKALFIYRYNGSSVQREQIDLSGGPLRTPDLENHYHQLAMNLLLAALTGSF